jgi:prenylcysteine oxidase / farnesylcysteine lyase
VAVSLDFPSHVASIDRVCLSGTASVHPYNDTTLPVLELGASIFFDANNNQLPCPTLVMRASNEFNLTRLSPQASIFGLALWDGEKMILNVSPIFSLPSGSTLEASYSGLALADGGTTSNRSGDTDITHLNERTDCEDNLFLRILQLNLGTLFNSVQSIFMQSFELYAMESRKWDNVSNLAATFGWGDMAAQPLSSYLEHNGISKIYIHEVVDAVTRLNYGHVCLFFNSSLGYL